MDVESCWRVVGSERRSLAEQLESLTDEQWETRSLCVGWRVRDVAAHVALVPTAPGLLGLIGGVVKVGGNPQSVQPRPGCATRGSTDRRHRGGAA